MGIFDIFKRKKADPYMLRNALSRTAFTPDISILEQRYFQMFFAYGTQMRGHRDHELVEGSPIRPITAFTCDRFVLWNQKLGKNSQPILMEVNGKASFVHPRIVRGELYVLRPQRFIALDNHLQNTVQFQRKRISLVIPYRKIRDLKSLRPFERKFVEEQLGVGITTNGIVTQEEQQIMVRAWAYVGIPDYWDPMLDGGYSFSPVKSFPPKNPRLEQYFQYTQLEYEIK